MRRAVPLLVVIALAILSASAANALGRTPNMIVLDSQCSAPADDGAACPGQKILGEYRIFDNSDNRTWAVGVQSGIDPRSDIEGWFTSMRSETDDLAGTMRSSRWDAVSLSWVRFLTERDAPTKWALVPNIDLATRRIVGRNEGSGEEAYQRNTNPGLALIVQRQFGPMTVAFEPKVIWMRNSVPTSASDTIAGFGRIVTLGIAVTRPVLGGEFVGDVAVCVSGNNVVDGDTGEPDQAVIWGAGWQRALDAAGTKQISLFATNAGGPSMATSVLAAPNSDYGFGARIDCAF